MTQPATLVLLPGFDGTGELFAPFQEALGSTHRTIVVRYRDERSFDDYVESASSAISDHQAILIAESFSGPVAVALAARYPSRFRAIVLCATFATSPFRPLTHLARFVPAAMFAPNPSQQLILRRFCLNGHHNPVLLAKALATIRSVPAATIRDRIEVLSRVDVRPLCSGIEIPTLLLRATHDRIVSLSRSTQLARALPHALVREVNAAHLLLQSRPADCARIIQQFVSCLPATDASRA